MILPISSIFRLYKFDVLSLSLTNRTLTNITATFSTICFETILTHHNMSTTCVDHARFIIKAKFALLLIVVLIILCTFCLRLCLLYF